jgi:hypothetical protein
MPEQFELAAVDDDTGEQSPEEMVQEPAGKPATAEGPTVYQFVCGFDVCTLNITILIHTYS